MSDTTNGPVGQPDGEQPQPVEPQAPEQAAPVAAEPTPVAPTPVEERPQPRYGEYAPQDAQPTQPVQQTQPTEPVPPAQAAHPTQPYPGQPQAPQYGAPQNGAPQYGAPQQPPYAQQAPQQPYPSSFAHSGDQPGAQQPGPHPYGTGAFFEQKAPKPPRDRKPLSRKTIGLIAAGLVVGAILGGAAGGGIGAAVSGSKNPVVASGTTGAQTVTVNDPADATQITAVAQAASPSVVTINVTSSQESGTGSGVILSSDGYVLTNTHVVTLDGDVADATVQVQTNDGKLYSAKVIGTDPTDDLAVIKLQGASGLTPIKFADSSKLNVGQQVVAIGAPLGLAGTVTDGIISSLNRSISIASSAAPTGGDQSQSGGGDGSDSGSSPFNFWNFGDGSGGDGSDGSGGGSADQPAQQATIALPTIQTDASINPGNSGGALLNTKGELIGINVAIASTGGTSDDGTQSGSIGVGFAIPSNVVQRIADELKTKGTATHGLLGASVSDASAATDATTVGAKIEQITASGAADKAGLKAGDVITSFNGIPITNATDLTAQVRSAAAGSSATVDYVSGGQTHQANVTLGSYNPNS